MRGRILIVDDEPHIVKTMSIGLTALGYDVTAFEDAEAALKEIDKDLFGERTFDIAFLDLMMYPMNGITLMQELNRRMPDVTIVIVTAHGTVETAVVAMKLGAYDYLQKPFELRDLAAFTERVMKSRAMLAVSRGSNEILTQNSQYLGVLRMAERVASSQLAVIIEGETGTGKELVADFIHRQSDRKDKPIVKLNCAALSAELVESELFGHVRGAFTGAMKDRAGRVEAADGGTLFLDEIGEMPIAMQAKLLRFLQSREFQRVGENMTRAADVRIIAATNRNLEDAIQRGEFREDLFYRLSGVRLLIPPLRFRKEDILMLSERFAATGKKSGAVPELSEAVKAALLEYDWRGNVRELENTMLRASVLAGDRHTLEMQDLPDYLRSGIGRHEDKFPFSNTTNAATSAATSAAPMRSLEEIEREYIAEVIARTSSLEEAARVLKIDSATLWRKRKKYSL